MAIEGKIVKVSGPLVIAEGMKQAAEHYGAICIELEDIDKVSGHPTSLGMAQIKEQVKAALEREL